MPAVVSASTASTPNERSRESCSNFTSSCGTPAAMRAASAGVAAPAMLGLRVPRRIDAIHPEVDAEFRTRDAVVHRQVFDPGLHQHVLAQQHVAGVLLRRLVEDDV